MQSDSAPKIRPDPVVVWAERIVGLAAVAALTVYFAVAWFRIRFPFELEWLEALLLHHAQRVLAGLPVYVRPSLTFYPVGYPPLYYWISAAACRLFGLRFFSLRLVSVAASAGSFVVIFAMVRRETGRALWGLAAAGMFAATYRACGAWLDIARIDSLFVFLLLLALAMMRFAETPTGAAAAGLCAAAALFTKQTALTAIGPALAWAVIFRGRRSLPMLATFAATATVGMFLLNRASGGWFWRLCYVFMSQQTVELDKLPLFFTELLVRRMPLATAATAAFFVVQIRREPLAARTWFYPAALAGAMIGSVAAYLSPTGADNSFLQTAALLAVGGSLAAAGTAPAARRWQAMAIGAICLAQFFMLRYDPRPLLPDEASASAGERWVGAALSFAGDVFVPCNSALGTAAGKKTFGDEGTWNCFPGADESMLRGAIVDEMATAFANGRFDAVFLADFERPLLAPLLERQYQLVRVEPANPLKFGFFPRSIYVRRDLLGPPAAVAAD